MVHVGYFVSSVFLVFFALFYILHAHDVLYNDAASKIVGGDTVTYLSADYVAVIPSLIDGIATGDVKLGSMMSFLGPMLHIGASKELFGEYYYLFIFVVNILMYLLFVRNVITILREMKVCIKYSPVITLFLFANPFYFNYLTGVNKELISLLYLSGVLSAYYKKNYASFFVYTLFASFYREIYIAISLIFYYVSWNFGNALLRRVIIVVIFSSLILPFIVPDDFVDSMVSLHSTQRSLPVWSFLAVITFDYYLYMLSFPFKVILNLFSSLYPPVLIENIFNLNFYAIISFFNSVFIVFFIYFFNKNVRFIDNNVLSVLCLIFSFLFVVSINPISVSRYSYPVVFLFALTLLILNSNRRFFSRKNHTSSLA